MATVTKPKVDTIRPVELVDLARAGKIRIPPFQRPFRWDRLDVVRLFDSVLHGYPVGNLLMWRRPAPAASVTIGPLPIDAPGVPDALWVVDGQQRVTSLIGALAAPADTTDPRFRIYFDLGKGRRFLSTGRQQVPDDWLPASVALDNRLLLEWQRERPWLSDRQFGLCGEVATALRDYEIPMYVVESEDEQALREIFDRLNSFGKRLTSSEVFQALHFVADQRQPSDLRALGDKVRALGFGELPQQVLWQSVMASRGPRIDRDFREEFRDDEDRHAAFVSTEQAIREVVRFLREDAGIPHYKLVPYAAFVPVLVRFVALFGRPEGRAADLLRRWVWRGASAGMQSSLPAQRGYASMVADSPLKSAERLLRLLGPDERDPRWRPDLGQVQLNRAQTKVNVLALLSARPRIVVPDDGSERRGDPVEAAGLMERFTSPLAEVLSLGRDAHPLAATIANRVVHPPRLEGAIRFALSSGAVEEEVLTSHCLDAECARLLRAGDEAGFLERRARLVTETITRHVRRNAEWSFRDGALVRSLFDDEDGPHAA